jgi:predicted dehydrogenase
MSGSNRRDFLVTASGLALSPALAAGLFAQDEPKAEAKPEPVRLAIMGVNGRGRQLMNVLAKFPEAEIAWICDPDSATLDPAVKQWTEAGRPAPQTGADFRRALDDKSVDALVCAAPDHWHALATIWACQAGKDVYVEKPCCHNPVEGRRMIQAARKYQRIVQVGTQRRSAPDMAALAEYIRGGKLGQVKFVRTWITSVRPSIGKIPVSSPPKNLDFNLWAGPGPENAYKSNLVHYHWHWRWDFGTGECGNNGIHGLDVARWGTGVDTPTRITCGGGRYFFEDDQETPDTQLATFEFPGLAIQWEHRTWSPRGLDGETFGVEFYGTEGTLLTNGRGWTVYDSKNAVVTKVDPGESDANHWRNFFDCLRTRSIPNADIEINHRSTMLCHLANIAWRTRSVLDYDGTTETIAHNPSASALLGRQYRQGFELPVI